MSINLVDLVLKQVGGNLPGMLGSLLGESAAKTEGALAGAVPAIIGSLIGAASKGGDTANQLTAMIADQDDSLLDNFTGMLTSGKHQEIAAQGSSMLSSLLGDGVIGGLVGAIGKFSGLGSGSTKSLLGMLAPIVMSVLSREQKTQGLDGGGLVNMLMSQKENIESAMPAGMASALGGAGLLDSLMGSAQSATASISEAVDTAVGKAGKAVGATATAAGQAVQGGSSDAGQTAASRPGEASGAAPRQAASTRPADSGGSSWMRWALPLIILLALIWLGFNFLGGGETETTVNEADETTSSTVEETSEATSDAADEASDATSSAVESTTEAASDTADEASDAASSAVESTTEAASDAADEASDATSSAVESTTEAASDAADAASDAASSAVESTTEAASDAADTAGDALSSAAEATGDATDAAGDAAGAAGGMVSAMVGDVDVGGELSSMFDDMTTTLSGITDIESAEAAIPSLEAISADLDGMTGLADQLPEGAMSGLSEMVDSGLSGIDSAMESLKSTPGVGELIEPIVAEIKEKLAAFTTA